MEFNNLAFGLELDKDAVRRILAVHYKPDPNSRGPSWLTAPGHAKDSLWSVDLFRTESTALKTHWIMVIMDQYTRRIVGFAVHAGNVDGPPLCRMFNDATSGQGWPQRVSSDHDPLFQHHRWKTNVRVLKTEEIRSPPHVPMSHPFVERLIDSGRENDWNRPSSGLRLNWRTSRRIISKQVKRVILKVGYSDKQAS